MSSPYFLHQVTRMMAAGLKNKTKTCKDQIRKRKLWGMMSCYPIVQHKIMTNETDEKSWFNFLSLKCYKKKIPSTRMRFELMRAEHNRLAVCRLNHSATTSCLNEYNIEYDIWTTFHPTSEVNRAAYATKYLQGRPTVFRCWIGHDANRISTKVDIFVFTKRTRPSHSISLKNIRILRIFLNYKC